MPTHILNIKRLLRYFAVAYPLILYGYGYNKIKQFLCTLLSGRVTMTERGFLLRHDHMFTDISCEMKKQQQCELYWYIRNSYPSRCIDIDIMYLIYLCYFIYDVCIFSNTHAQVCTHRRSLHFFCDTYIYILKGYSF